MMKSFASVDGGEVETVWNLEILETVDEICWTEFDVGFSFVPPGSIELCIVVTSQSLCLFFPMVTWLVMVSLVLRFNSKSLCRKVSYPLLGTCVVMLARLFLFLFYTKISALVFPQSISAQYSLATPPLIRFAFLDNKCALLPFSWCQTALLSLTHLSLRSLLQMFSLVFLLLFLVATVPVLPWYTLYLGLTLLLPQYQQFLRQQFLRQQFLRLVVCHSMLLYNPTTWSHSLVPTINVELWNSFLGPTDWQ